MRPGLPCHDLRFAGIADTLGISSAQPVDRIGSLEYLMLMLWEGHNDVVVGASNYSWALDQERSL